MIGRPPTSGRKAGTAFMDTSAKWSWMGRLPKLSSPHFRPSSERRSTVNTLTKPLPVGGLVFTQHYLNAGLNRQEAETTLSILPVLGQLRQGRLVSGRHFSYRYNTDGKTIVAALAAFNDNFFVRVFATHDKALADALVEVHAKPPVSVGGLKALAGIWQPLPKRKP